MSAFPFISKQSALKLFLQTENYSGLSLYLLSDCIYGTRINIGNRDLESGNFKAGG